MLHPHQVFFPLLLFVPVGSALATPNLDFQSSDAQQALRQQQELIESMNQPATVPVLTTEEASFSRRLPQEAPCLAISAVEIDSANLPAARLVDALSGPAHDDAPQGKCLGLNGIGLLLNRLNDALIGQGYLTTQTMMAGHDAVSGMLRIRVIPGRVGRYLWADGGQSTSQFNLALPKPGEALNIYRLEQALDNLQEINGATARLEILPSLADGESDIRIYYTSPPPLRATFRLDNSGSKQTGKFQSLLGLDFNNPGRLNDQLRIFWMRDAGNSDPGPRGTRGYFVQYSLPFRDWKLTLAQSEGRHRKTEKGWTTDYLYHGRVFSQELALDRVLSRGQSQITSAKVKLYRQHTKNFINDTEVQVQRRRVAGWEAHALRSQQFRIGKLDADFSYRKGTGAFSAQPAPEDKFGEGDARAAIYEADVGWQQFFPLSFGTLQYKAMLRGQWSKEVLPHNERVCFGGRSSVRALYGEHSLCGDKGVHVQNELKLIRPLVSPYWGLDWAEVNGKSAERLVKRNIKGIYFGLQGGNKTLQFDTFVGMPLWQQESIPLPQSILGFSISLAF